MVYINVTIKMTVMHLKMSANEKVGEKQQPKIVFSLLVSTNVYNG